MIQFVFIFIFATVAAFAQQAAEPLQLKSAISDFQLPETQTKARLKDWFTRPHPFGSSQQKELSIKILHQLNAHGDFGIAQNFSVLAPQKIGKPKQISGKNLIALLRSPSQNCVVMLGAHYDTKDLPHFMGANDGGSGSVLLFELFEYLRNTKIYRKSPCGFLFVWFDGEEAVLPNWNDGEHVSPPIKDNTYGSRYFADSLKPGRIPCFEVLKQCYTIHRAIVVDMIGSDPLLISQDSLSSPGLLKLLQEGVVFLKFESFFSTQLQAIEDDHFSLVKKGIPTILLIDFSHLERWHKPTDTWEHVSIKSMNIAGHLALFLALKN